MKKTLFGLLFLAVIVITGCGSKPNSSTSVETPIPAGKFYFHSKTCVHCAKVDDFIAAEQVKQRLYFIDREIESDPGAIALLKLVGKKCGIPDNELGVPLFWDGANCYTGDVEVINYFKSQIQ